MTDIFLLWSEFLQKIRTFFTSRGYVEVFTPYLQPFPNLDSHIDPVEVLLNTPEGRKRFFLHTSPEYSMKKLLPRIRSNIFQICRVFRNGEWSDIHRPEFHMLEFYKIGATYKDLIEEVKALLNSLFKNLDFKEADFEKAFVQILGVEPEASSKAIKHALEKKGVYVSAEDEDLIFFTAVSLVEKTVCSEGLVFLKDYPQKLKALAKVVKGKAQRFELFWSGIEIANGWTEETEPEEVKNRLVQEAQKRNLPLDEEFVKAHESMPECAGCSIGLDRLFLFYANLKSLGDLPWTVRSS